MTQPYQQSERHQSERHQSERRQLQGHAKDQRSESHSWETWYEFFDTAYSLEERRQWYSQAARNYHWARPRYPQELIEGVIGAAQLSTASTVLEVGCGPGIATLDFAARGLQMHCVEPSEAACEIARASCKDYPNIEVVESTFEEWSLEEWLAKHPPFDAVLAATSFHWLSPDVAYQKSAAALRPNGHLILMWATPPQLSEQLSADLQPTYEKFGLLDLWETSYRTAGYYRKNFESFAQKVSDSGYFQPSQVEIEAFESTYSIEKYLALLSTLSSYIALASEKRIPLLEAIGKQLSQQLNIEANAYELETQHWFAGQVTQRT